MKNALALTALLLVAAAAGCEAPDEGRAPSDSLDSWLVTSIQNLQIDNAIIAQRTIYPYHFLRDSADLNELGQRDLKVLAEHLRDAGGELNVHRGKASEALYAARVTAVVEGLASAGVATERVRIVDKLPGGDGISTERLVKILEKEDQ